jgi:hypothetical protein
MVVAVPPPLQRRPRRQPPWRQLLPHKVQLLQELLTEELQQSFAEMKIFLSFDPLIKRSLKSIEQIQVFILILNPRHIFRDGYLRSVIANSCLHAVHEYSEGIAIVN